MDTLYFQQIIADTSCVFSIFCDGWHLKEKYAILKKEVHEMERCLQGYCRNIDAARLVLVEADESGTEIDCSYEVCAYRETCPIGRQITELMQQEKKQ